VTLGQAKYQQSKTSIPIKFKKATIRQVSLIIGLVKKALFLLRETSMTKIGRLKRLMTSVREESGKETKRKE
jgi:hypothetical protein